MYLYLFFFLHRPKTHDNQKYNSESELSFMCNLHETANSFANIELHEFD